MGRIVYMSDIFEILTEEDFQFTGTVDQAIQKTITIKADTFYCSEKVS